MPRKTKSFNCRISESDYERLRINAERLQLSPSDYIRYLIRIPIDLDGLITESAVITIDTNTFGKIHRELVRQGYHYNQAVHALNSIALFIKRGGSNVKYYSEQFERVNRNLESVQAKQALLAEEIDRLEQSTLIGG